MKKTQYFIVTLSIILFILLTNSALANTQTDGTTDVFHYNLLDNVWGWETQVNRPNIDITQISYNVFKERIEFKLEIAGEFQSNENIEYGIIFISTDASYNISWSAGNGSGLAIVLNESSYVIDNQPNITV